MALVPQINDGGAREFLLMHDWPIGLQEELIKNLTKYPIRFYVCDDSGSMMTRDGNRLVPKNGTCDIVPCTRWDELTSSLEFHMKLARAANAPTEFRLLNGAEPLLLGNSMSGTDEAAGVATMEAIFREGPRGGTPLCRHIREIIEKVRAMEKQLRANRQMACVIIATDGESSDGDVAAAMKPLKDLPVWVVIRMCTDDERVTNYWNNIDNILEVDMDVLDDFQAESKEVLKVNPWLTYGMPMHRLREFGCHLKEFDILDEAKLTMDQMHKMARIIYGSVVDSFPRPDVDFAGFLKAIAENNAKVKKTFCPKDKRDREWIEPKNLNRTFGKGKGCTIC